MKETANTTKTPKWSVTNREYWLRKQKQIMEGLTKTQWKQLSKGMQWVLKDLKKDGKTKYDISRLTVRGAQKLNKDCATKIMKLLREKQERRAKAAKAAAKKKASPKKKKPSEAERRRVGQRQGDYGDLFRQTPVRDVRSSRRARKPVDRLGF